MACEGRDSRIGSNFQQLGESSMSDAKRKITDTRLHERERESEQERAKEKNMFKVETVR